MVQNDFNWESHISSQCAKIYNGLRVLKLSSSTLSTAIKLKLFKALILPHFLYGDVFLLNASASALERLRIALNCCVRFVFGLSRFSRVSHLQQELIGCRFHDFFKLRSCLMLFKIINTSSPPYLREKIHSLQSSRTRSFLLLYFEHHIIKILCLCRALFFGICYLLSSKIFGS